MQVAFDLLDEMLFCPQNFREWPDEVLYNCMMDMCVRFRDLPSALALFNQMKMQGRQTTKHRLPRTRLSETAHAPQIEPSPVTYGILIKAYGQENQLDQAFEIFTEMKQRQLVASNMTYGCLLQACVKNNRIDAAIDLFQ